VTRRAGDRPSLTLEQRRQRFWARERRDFEVWHRLTPRQRRTPYWRQRERQWQNAAKVGLIMLAAGDELPELLARALAPPPATGSPSVLFASHLESVLFASHLEDVPRRAAGDRPWGSAWGSPWPRPAKEER
jgi:hypothetical protein